MPFPNHPERWRRQAAKKPLENPNKTPELPPKLNPKQSFRSNSQVICPGRLTGSKSCRIKSHPTVPGGRYCDRHQKICGRCEGSPRHMITEKCHSCMRRWKKEDQNAKKKN